MIDQMLRVTDPVYAAFCDKLNERARVYNAEQARINGDWILPLLVLPAVDPHYAPGGKAWAIVDIIPSGPVWWRNKRIKALGLARKYQLKRDAASFAHWMTEAKRLRRAELMARLDAVEVA